MRFNQTTDLASRRDIKKSFLGLFTALVCLLFAAGCSSGGGSEGFVAAPTGSPIGAGGNANAGNGSVTFNFVRAQANAIVVPATTINLRFEFFTGLSGTGALVKSQTEPFAATITINDVPSSVRSTVVTALTAEGFPVAEFTGSIVVPAGGTVTVDATGGVLEPVTPQSVSTSPLSVGLQNGASVTLVPRVVFSNGDTIDLSGALASSATFTSNNPSVATVSPDGVITAVANGSTSIVIDFLGTQFTVPVAVGTGVIAAPTVTSVTLTAVEALPVTLPVGAASQPLSVEVLFENGNTETISTFPDSRLTFNTTNPNIPVLPATGQISISNSAVTNETADVSVTFTPEGSQVGTNSNTVSVLVSAAVLETLTANPMSIELPFGGFEQTVTVSGQFSDGMPYNVGPDQLTFDNNTSPLFTVDNDTGVVTTAANGTAGTGTLTITTQGLSPNQSVDVPVGVGNVAVANLVATPNSVTLGPGGGQTFQITATLADAGSTQIDVSNFEALTATVTQSGGDTDIVANGNEVVAVSSTVTGTPASVEFALGGATVSVNVTVQDEVLTSVKYFFAGNEITGPVVNLPRGYVGIIEVEGTFNTGVTRMLTFNEYDVTLNNDLSTDPRDMVRLFDDTYTMTPLTASYLDNAPAGGGAFDSDTAVVDDLYLFGAAGIRQADPNAAGSTSEGSATPVVATRDTFRALAADWPRGEGINNTLQGSAAAPFLAPDVLDVAPGSTDVFNVVLRENVTGVTTGTSPLDLEAINCTIIDPVRMSYGETGFVNYPEIPEVPVGTVRQYDVRVNFDVITVTDQNQPTDGTVPSIGPRTETIENFKLAEANILVTSASGGQNPFARQAPTSLGFAGVTSPTAVNVNNLTVRALPLPGSGARPIVLEPPTGTGAGGDYVAATYAIDTRVFGATPGLTELENPALVDSRDPGPAPDRAARPPADSLILDVVEPGDATVDFVIPLLFTLDPINDGGVGTPNEIEVGASSTYRTLVQFDANSAPVDMSLDYPPTLIASQANPALASRADDSPNPTPGRTIVSAINDGGSNVIAQDVLDETGYTGLSAAPDVAAAIGVGVQGLVIAVDVAGNPIPEVGNFTDQNGVTGPGQSVTTVNAIPTP